MKAWQGSMGISDYEGIVSPAYFVYVLLIIQLFRSICIICLETAIKTNLDEYPAV